MDFPSDIVGAFFFLVKISFFFAIIPCPVFRGVFKEKSPGDPLPFPKDSRSLSDLSINLYEKVLIRTFSFIHPPHYS